MIVERVEEVGAEFEIHLFSDLGVLGQRNVQVLVAGTVDCRYGRSDAHVAERGEVRLKGCGVQVRSAALRVVAAATM